ncbi:MAG: transcriptional regulator [Candidatus Synechococcus spongiarum 142]|uniref:Transcriptional regulator n=1 Tax=Candidatus Synechococcus spongiarum 142 TaxID=1608213 RepID=A0A6N3X3W0_9SYNE|nr:MAG: transcriptional regulator [Candidatus Synechococcus spongiarum 142]
MQPYSTRKLEELLAGGEMDWVEFKQVWGGDARKKGTEAVCAFANDLANHNHPGVLFVGVKDDGTPYGLPIGGQLLEQLTGIKTDGKILPPPTLLVEKRTLKGLDVAVVTVWPADSPPVRYDGRICVRCGPRRGVATAQDERILNEKRRFRDQPFDSQPCHGATIANLDLPWYKENYLPAAVAAEVLDDNGRRLDEQLASTRMILSPDEPTPTHLGVLTLANQPTDFLPCAYVQFLKLDGPILADDILDEQVFTGRMVDVIRAVEEKLNSHNRTMVEFRNQTTERRTQIYPQAAIQQLFRNAIMHRTYEHDNTPVRITWYSDRMEIISPGGPVGMVTRENFGRPGFTGYRNPNLAGFLRELGFAQRFGAGIAIARSECERNGNAPPEFDVQDQVICATRKPANSKEAEP